MSLLHVTVSAGQVHREGQRVRWSSSLVGDEGQPIEGLLSVLLPSCCCGEAGHTRACGMFSPPALQMMDFTHHIISARGRRCGLIVDSSREECAHECANETTPTAKHVCVCNSM